MFRELIRSGIGKAAGTGVVRRWLSERIAEYGDVVSLAFDPEAGTATCVLLLHGESDPVEIHVARYELVREQDEAFVIVREASASRQWLTAVIRNVVVGRRIRVSENSMLSKALAFVS